MSGFDHNYAARAGIALVLAGGLAAIALALGPDSPAAFFAVPGPAIGASVGLMGAWRWRLYFVLGAACSVLGGTILGLAGGARDLFEYATVLSILFYGVVVAAAVPLGLLVRSSRQLARRQPGRAERRRAARDGVEDARDGFRSDRAA